LQQELVLHDWKNATTVSSPPPKPRGVLHPRLPHGDFRHERRVPGAALAAFVEHYWFVAWDLRGLPPQRQETLPHPSVHLVVEPPAARIYGVHQGRFVRMLEGEGRVFGIKFRPGGFRPFYGRPVAALMDGSCAPHDVFGPAADRFEAEVLATTDIDGMAQAAERLLLGHLPAPDPSAERAAALVAGIAADRALVAVEQLCEREGLNARALQRLFKNYVGIGPKWVINRYRLHEAIARLQEGQAMPWAELALSLGYFDQAHFIRDFRALVGCAPAEYARRLAASAQSTG
jgi:AraC-like DNA-binding protein